MHINAFTLGCKERFAGCVVKVVFTGSWHASTAEEAAAEYLWHVAKCDLITHDTDTAAAQHRTSRD